MSTIIVSNIGNGTTTVGSEYVLRGVAKAWANYDQTVPSLNDSLNVSSVTDQAAGDSRVNLTNNMSSANHAPLIGNNANINTPISVTASSTKGIAPTTSVYSVVCSSSADAGADPTDATSATIGDLA